MDTINITAVKSDGLPVTSQFDGLDAAVKAMRILCGTSELIGIYMNRKIDGQAGDETTFWQVEDFTCLHDRDEHEGIASKNRIPLKMASSYWTAEGTRMRPQSRFYNQ